jgi:hypothetical protein
MTQENPPMYDPFRPDFCTCPSTADVLRAELEGVDLEPCAAHESPPDTADVVPMPLNAPRSELAARIGVALTTPDPDGPAAA